MTEEIKLTSDGSHTFSITLGEVVYQFNTVYNTRAGMWTLNISTGGVSIIEGVVLVGGVDVLKQYTLNLERLFLVNLNNPTEDPGPDNMGTDARLFLLSAEEISSVV